MDLSLVHQSWILLERIHWLWCVCMSLRDRLISDTNSRPLIMQRFAKPHNSNAIVIPLFVSLLRNGAGSSWYL
ncbi:hypothetical protein Y032_0032g2565 [Ancylostoma ceylanicum]|nr:hypothetical protein Y032_0032g2565 [Ancylostoma ceylanicum]